MALVLAILPAADAREQHVSRTTLEISLKDGSHLKSSPVDDSIRISSSLGGDMALRWVMLKQVNLEAGRAGALVEFENGDRLTVAVGVADLEVDCVLGRVKVPVHAIQKIVVSVVEGDCRNVALGKPVHGADGASNGEGLAKHVTDGDPATHAKPPASNFDYRIDLQAGEDVSYRIDEAVIHWGHFGDQFLGVRKHGSEQWAAAAWPGEYVTSYTLECLRRGSDEWQKVHEYHGRPVNEQGPGVVVEKQPSMQQGCSSESLTRLQGLQLKGVVQLRIRASGGHWIGLFELEAIGVPESP